MIVTSPQNARVKQIRALRTRKERERTGLFFVDGLHLVVEAIRTGSPIQSLVVAPELIRSAAAEAIVQRQIDLGCPCLAVSADVFRDLAPREFVQGVGAVVHQTWRRIEEIGAAGEFGWIALAGTQYPGNLGTILRTADAVQADGVLLLDATADPYDPIAVRATAGAIFSTSLARATFAAFVAWARDRSLPIVGTAPDAPTDYRSTHYRTPLVLLMGSEGQGLPAERLEVCDCVVRIPMSGRCDSLNLAVATGVLLYEIFEQRRRGRPDASQGEF